MGHTRKVLNEAYPRKLAERGLRLQKVSYTMQVGCHEMMEKTIQEMEVSG